MTNWIIQIENITETFSATFGDLTTEQLNWKPNAHTWSIAQNMDHLIIVNETYFPILASLKAGTYKPPFIANFGFIVSSFGKLVLNSVKADQRKKIKTFQIWEPTNSQIANDILQRFSEHQDQLKKQIGGAEDLIRKGTVIASPAKKSIVYKLDMAFDIIIAHEQRHLEQAKDVFHLLTKDNTGSQTF